jgi:hypothetical protein
MSRILTQGIFALLITIGTTAVAVTGANAGSRPEYAFSVKPAQVKAGTLSTFTVQLSSPNKSPVSGAQITATRLDMGPDGMAEMTAPIKPVNSGSAVGQAFSATLPAAGRWAVSLEATVPGDTGPVRGQVVLEAR